MSYGESETYSKLVENLTSSINYKRTWNGHFGSLQVISVVLLNFEIKCRLWLLLVVVMDMVGDRQFRANCPNRLLLETIFQSGCIFNFFSEECCFYACKTSFGPVTLPWILVICAGPVIVIRDLTKLDGKRQCDWRFGHAWQTRRS